MFRLPQPRARDMLDAGVIVALGSDFNPNAYCCSMVSAGCLTPPLSLSQPHSVYKRWM